MSGESLRVMIVFTRSIVTTVFGFDGPSGASWYQPSSAASRAHFSKRPSGLMVAPRPLAASPWFPAVVFRGMNRVYPRRFGPPKSIWSNNP
jgi:hypothetical protein